MDYRFGFVLEQTLGHKTFALNLQAQIAANPDIAATILPVEFHPPTGRIPVLGRNYSFRASLYARQQATRAARAGRIDAFFYHTQVSSLFSNRLMRSIPSIISLDATPLNYDTVGSGYGHTTRAGSLAERLKLAINRRAFRAARRLVTWSEWAKRSLVADYGVPSEKVHVIIPGVDLTLWSDVGLGRVMRAERPRILFVGGDFRRKGGPLLLDVFRRRFRDRAELHLVTGDPVPPEPNVFVYNNLGSNADGLRRLFHEADLFVLPTSADVSSLASCEAMSARLPVITTAVGAIPELIEEGASGFLIPDGDGDLLAERIVTLIADPERRRSMGERAGTIARERFDARKNMQMVLDLLKQIARPAPRTGE